MPPLPARSSGVWSSPLGDHLVLFDAVPAVLHVLNPTAALVWAACDGATPVAAFVASTASASGVDGAVVEDGLAACLAQFTVSELVGRADGTVAQDRPAEAPVAGAVVVGGYEVLDRRVAFRGDDAALLGEVDRLLGSQRADGPVDLELGLDVAADGTVRLSGFGDEVGFGPVGEALDQLPSALNQVAAASITCLAFHAGGVRRPDGSLVLLPATSGSGKSTLTAALVQAGWAYASDEAVGVHLDTLEVVGYPKPVVLDAASRAVLGLPADPSPNVAIEELRPGAVDRRPLGRAHAIVLPTFVRGAATELVTLDPIEAVAAVAEHALNLRLLGPVGLDALVRLVASTPCFRLVHGGAGDAVEALEVAPLSPER